MTEVEITWDESPQQREDVTTVTECSRCDDTGWIHDPSACCAHRPFHARTATERRTTMTEVEITWWAALLPVGWVDFVNGEVHLDLEPDGRL